MRVVVVAAPPRLIQEGVAVETGTLERDEDGVVRDRPRVRAELRDPETLEMVEEVGTPTLLALAVWVGSVRLIDNRVLHPGRLVR